MPLDSRGAGRAGAAGAVPDPAALHRRVADWFAANARDLPWRRADRTPWGVLVSEFMLQQTPVARVLPVWREWLARWPSPADLAAEPAGEAVRAWGRLGYPRRALRLHAAAQAIVERHGGRVPGDPALLLALPGVGAYTAAAVASFAFGIPETVLDTNIRRVHARAVSGRALPERGPTAAEWRLAHALMPPADGDGGALANAWNAGAMELGALVCTARAPRCGECPLLDSCAWVAAGRPEPHYTPTGQAWAGTDRQVRGAIMAVLREAPGPVPRGALVEASGGGAAARGNGAAGGADPDGGPDQDCAADPDGAAGGAALARLWALPADGAQRLRCLDGLLADGLAHESPAGVALPH